MHAQSSTRTYTHTHKHETSFFIILDVHIGDSLELEGREVREKHGEKDGWVKHKHRTTVCMQLQPFFPLRNISCISFYIFSSCSLLVFLLSDLLTSIENRTFHNTWPPQCLPSSRSVSVWMRLFQIPEILTQSLIKPIRTDKRTPEGLARGRVFTGGNRGSCNSTRQMCNSPSGGGVLKYFFYEKEMVLKFGFTKIFQTVPCLFPPNNQLLVNEAHNRFLWESACVFFFCVQLSLWLNPEHTSVLSLSCLTCHLSWRFIKTSGIHANISLKLGHYQLSEMHLRVSVLHQENLCLFQGCSEG